MTSIYINIDEAVQRQKEVIKSFYDNKRVGIKYQDVQIVKIVIYFFIHDLGVYITILGLIMILIPSI